MITRMANASDTLDVALDTLTQPMVNKQAVDLAQPFLTGFLASALGTANDAMTGISVGTEVGSVGFPSDGLLGAGIEIALPMESAFGFLQSKILDRITQNRSKPFFGYVSIRLCSQTTTLLGMQQWPTSVMVEVVAFGDDWGKEFMAGLQKDALLHIREGKDAMLHWGLENDQMLATDLTSIPALKAKLPIFKRVRSLLAAAAPAVRVFDNAFTTRLGL
jgi:hypothetical protein